VSDVFHLAATFNNRRAEATCGAAVVKSQAMEGRSGVSGLRTVATAPEINEAAFMVDRTKNMLQWRIEAGVPQAKDRVG
jgi:hypothetical protein